MQRFSNKSFRFETLNEPSKFYGQAERAISTGQLNALLRLHTQPINVVVFHGPSEGMNLGKSHLEEGFALICFQRLS